MFDVASIRKQFPILNEKMNNNKLIYFDSAATSLKPQCVIDEIVDYYSKLGANTHRGDYELSYKVDVKFDSARETIAKFFNTSSQQIIFTQGTTASLNLVASSFFEIILKNGDEIIINHAEHASNVLPWYNIAKKTGAKIVFAPLTENGELTLNNLKSVVNSNTKLIAFAHVTNTIADTRCAKEICDFASKNNVYTVLDGAQCAPHTKVDLEDLNCDFYAVSAHKMCGPTGIGILYGKVDLLEQMQPVVHGGGMNARFNSACDVTFKKIPTIFEAGTPHIDGVLGYSKALEFLMDLGMDNVHNYIVELKKYAISKLEKLDNIEIYNKSTENGIILFNLKGVFAQDAASHFNRYGIAVRAGHHCAKLLNEQIGTNVTCRASFYFYNTKEEIDYFVEVASKGDEYLEAIF